MQIIVRDTKIITSSLDRYRQFSTPVWEIEIQSDLINSVEFENDLRNPNNYAIGQAHSNALRQEFIGTGAAKNLLAENQKEQILDIALNHPITKPRFNRPRQHYQNHAGWFSMILKDLPGFEMSPHIDNSHVMCHMIVNLLQDNQTSTSFYCIDSPDPVYSAPTKKNHGILFVNTPGALHSIGNVTAERWILYSSVVI